MDVNHDDAVTLKNKLNVMMKAKTQSAADLQARGSKEQSQVVRAQMLRRLLTAGSEEEK